MGAIFNGNFVLLLTENKQLVDFNDFERWYRMIVFFDDDFDQNIDAILFWILFKVKKNLSFKQASLSNPFQCQKKKKKIVL